jgi:hypothetical protein
MPVCARVAAFMAAGLFVMIFLISSAGAVAPPAKLQGLVAAELFAKARVVCEQRKEGRNIRTFFCNDGQTCVNVSGSWKCRSPAPAGMSCATCLANQKRDSDSCTRSGNLMQQSACVNRVNAEYLKCIPGCH